MFKVLTGIIMLIAAFSSFLGEGIVRTIGNIIVGFLAGYGLAAIHKDLERRY